MGQKKSKRHVKKPWFKIFAIQNRSQAKAKDIHHSLQVKKYENKVLTGIPY
jgi:hypothetical protein